MLTENTLAIVVTLHFKRNIYILFIIHSDESCWPPGRRSVPMPVSVISKVFPPQVTFVCFLFSHESFSLFMGPGGRATLCFWSAPSPKSPTICSIVVFVSFFNFDSCRIILYFFFYFLFDLFLFCLFFLPLIASH